MEDKFKSGTWKNILTHPITITAIFILIAVTAILVSHLTLNQYQIESDGKTTCVRTHNTDVDGILEQQNIVVNPADTLYIKPLAYRSQLISVHDTHKVSVAADGIVREYYATGGTVRNIFEQANLTLGENDTVRPALDTVVDKDIEVTVDRISYRTQTVREEIDPPVDDRSSGKDTIEVPGKAGLQETTFECKFVNGVLTEKKKTDEVVLREPTPTVIRDAIPTPAGTGVTLVSNPGAGAPTEYSSVLICETTAYTGGGTTASGKPAQVGRVAVDPRVIPLGTRLYIESENGSYVYGYAEAADTGGAIKGYKVDIYLDTYEQAIQFGRRNMRVYVLP